MGAVLSRTEIDHIRSCKLNFMQETKAITNMEDQQFSRLIELIHEHDYSWRFIDEQRKWDEGFEREKEIKNLLRNYLWDDVEPLVKEEWRKNEVKKMF